MPWTVLFSRGLHQGLVAFPDPYHLYEEFMDTSRFPGSAHQDQLARFLSGKYAGKTIAIVVTESDAAAAFFHSHPRLFPEARHIAFQTVRDVPSSPSHNPASQVESVQILTDFRGAIADMIRVADPRSVYVIADTDDHSQEKRLWSFQQAMAEVGQGIEAHYLLDVPMTALLSQLATLPPESAIFYLLMFDDGEGTPITPFEAARRIAETANAPIFSHWDSLMGSGILGGYLLSGERVGQIAARAIIAQLDRQPFTLGEGDAFVSAYDWGPLQRWGLDPGRLPRQTQIHNRPPDLWLVFKREIIILGLVSVGLFISLFLFQRNRLFKRMNAELSRLSMTDALTGLLNRRAIDTLLVQECARCQRTGHPLTVLIFDIDHFKRINDQYGHPQGDQVLTRLASTLQQVIRRTDHLARWGGEEFILLAVDSDLDQAAVIAEHIRAAVQAMVFADQIRATLSIGVAEYDPQEAVEHVCARADTALYRAKRTGRNRVAIDPRGADRQ
ncbi:MAG: GGDEF domain-containing protein [Lamprobacter sp.]|uniref:GGDEF domain-containing protein n=1 Tax=Lamprobacter sp. TaxID=3100796 RepID=UPI002B25C9A1|nr:GGDEF domain-containing protein [Lamprobacter sp.]MEA3642571.1 GGDEF domain-containing protein [Lamprobacter sp.]